MSQPSAVPHLTCKVKFGACHTVGVGGWGLQPNEQEKLGFLVKKKKRILEALFTYFNYFILRSPRCPSPAKKPNQPTKQQLNQFCYMLDRKRTSF